MSEEKNKAFLMASGATFLVSASVVALVVAAGLVISKGFLSPNPDIRSNVITVNGTGSAFAVPDVSTFSFTVSAEEKDLALAQEKVSEKLSKILKALEEAGIPEKDIQTVGIYSNPKYEWQNDKVICSNFYCPPSNGKQVLIGYEMSQTTNIKVRDLDKGSAVLSVLGDKDIQSFTGPQFEVDDDQAVKDEARSEAINDAQEKADKLASDLGVKLGKVIGFYENDNTGYPPYPLMDTAYKSASLNEMAGSPAPVSVGENEITSSVSITYQIK